MSIPELADLYMPHNIRSERTSDAYTVRITLEVPLPANRLWLEFQLKSIVGVVGVNLEEYGFTVTRKPDHNWETMLLRISERLIRTLGWKFSETAINGKRPGWDDFPGPTMLL